MTSNSYPADVVVVDPATAEPRPMARAGGRSVRLIDPGIGSQQLDLHLNVLEGGGDRESAPYHMHTTVENVYFVLEGRLGIRLEDRDEFVEAGQGVFIPPDIPHAVWNAGEGEARLLEIYTPPDADFVRLDEDGSKR